MRAAEASYLEAVLSPALTASTVDTSAGGSVSAHRLRGATGIDDVWLLWDIVVANGQVTDVQVLNRYLSSVSSGDAAQFSP